MLTPVEIEARRSGIGGSDVAAILGLSKWATPLQVYLSKRGELPPLESNPAMHWGNVLEPVIAAEFARVTGLRVNTGVGLIKSEPHPFMLANVDGITSDQAVLECKTARSADGWGEDGSEGVPVYYQTQVQHYLAVTGLQLGYVAVLIGGSDFRVLTVTRDDALIADLIEAERVFWHDHVLAGIPPAPISAEDAAILWKRDNGTELEVEEGLAADISRLKAIKAEIKFLEETAGEIDDRVRIAFGEAAALKHAGSVLATYKAQTAKRVDLKALEAAHPDLVAQFRRESVSRVLRIK